MAWGDLPVKTIGAVGGLITIALGLRKYLSDWTAERAHNERELAWRKTQPGLLCS
jgi:cadmium resistance protein CadD (predicted permease)